MFKIGKWIRVLWVLIVLSGALLAVGMPSKALAHHPPDDETPFGSRGACEPAGNGLPNLHVRTINQDTKLAISAVSVHVKSGWCENAPTAGGTIPTVCKTIGGRQYCWDTKYVTTGADGWASVGTANCQFTTYNAIGERAGYENGSGSEVVENIRGSRYDIIIPMTALVAKFEVATNVPSGAGVPLYQLTGGAADNNGTPDLPAPAPVTFYKSGAALKVKITPSPSSFTIPATNQSWVFDSWTGDCSVSSATCTATVEPGGVEKAYLTWRLQTFTVNLTVWPPEVKTQNGGSQAEPFTINVDGDDNVSGTTGGCTKTPSPSGSPADVKQVCTTTADKTITATKIYSRHWTITAPAVITNGTTPYAFVQWRIGVLEGTSYICDSGGGPNQECTLVPALGQTKNIRAEYAISAVANVNSNIALTSITYEDLEPTNKAASILNTNNSQPGAYCPHVGGVTMNSASGSAPAPSSTCVFNVDLKFKYTVPQYPNVTASNTDDTGSGHSADGNDYVFWGWNPPATGQVGSGLEPGCYDNGGVNVVPNGVQNTAFFCKVHVPKGRAKSVSALYYTTTLAVQSTPPVNIPITVASGNTKFVGSTPYFYDEPTAIVTTLRAPLKYYDSISQKNYAFVKWASSDTGLGCINATIGDNNCSVNIPQQGPSGLKATVTAEYATTTLAVTSGPPTGVEAVGGACAVTIGANSSNDQGTSYGGCTNYNRDNSGPITTTLTAPNSVSWQGKSWVFVSWSSPGLDQPICKNYSIGTRSCVIDLPRGGQGAVHAQYGNTTLNVNSAPHTGRAQEPCLVRVGYSGSYSATPDTSGCTAYVIVHDVGISTTLTAEASYAFNGERFYFLNWTGTSCALSTSITCNATVPAGQTGNVTANYVKETKLLVKSIGDTNVLIGVSDSSLICTNSKRTDFECSKNGDIVTDLTAPATSPNGKAFAGWTGACLVEPSNTKILHCTVPKGTTATATVEYTDPTPNAQIHVHSAPREGAGVNISCSPTTCSPTGTLATAFTVSSSGNTTLTATANNNFNTIEGGVPVTWTFVEWAGCVPAGTRTCTLSVTRGAVYAITANYSRGTHVNVTQNGLPSGTTTQFYNDISTGSWPDGTYTPEYDRSFDSALKGAVNVAAAKKSITVGSDTYDFSGWTGNCSPRTSNTDFCDYDVPNYGELRIVMNYLLRPDNYASLSMTSSPLSGVTDVRNFPNGCSQTPCGPYTSTTTISSNLGVPKTITRVGVSGQNETWTFNAFSVASAQGGVCAETSDATHKYCQISVTVPGHKTVNVDYKLITTRLNVSAMAVDPETGTSQSINETITVGDAALVCTNSKITSFSCTKNGGISTSLTAPSIPTSPGFADYRIVGWGGSAGCVSASTTCSATMLEGTTADATVEYRKILDDKAQISIKSNPELNVLVDVTCSVDGSSAACKDSGSNAVVTSLITPKDISITLSETQKGKLVARARNQNKTGSDGKTYIFVSWAGCTSTSTNSFSGDTCTLDNMVQKGVYSIIANYSKGTHVLINTNPPLPEPKFCTETTNTNWKIDCAGSGQSANPTYETWVEGNTSGTLKAKNTTTFTSSNGNKYDWIGWSGSACVGIPGPDSCRYDSTITAGEVVATMNYVIHRDDRATLLVNAAPFNVAVTSMSVTGQPSNSCPRTPCGPYSTTGENLVATITVENPHNEAGNIFAFKNWTSSDLSIGCAIVTSTTCSITVPQGKSVGITANYENTRTVLTVGVSPAQAGVTFTHVSGDNCAGTTGAAGTYDCVRNVAISTTFEAPSSISRSGETWPFYRWDGCVSVNARQCSAQVVKGAVGAVTATYVAPSPKARLSVNSAPAGACIDVYSGDVGTKTQPTGCRAPWGSERQGGISATLTAEQSFISGGSTFVFISWSGCDSVDNPNRRCTAAIADTEVQAVTANYSKGTHVLIESTPPTSVRFLPYWDLQRTTPKEYWIDGSVVGTIEEKEASTVVFNGVTYVFDRWISTCRPGNCSENSGNRKIYNINIPNGDEVVLTMVYRAQTTLLNVASNYPGVAITASPSTYGGTTPYTKTEQGTAISATLTAPNTFDVFPLQGTQPWTGCDETRNIVTPADGKYETCVVSIESGGAQNVFVAYENPNALRSYAVSSIDDDAAPITGSRFFYDDGSCAAANLVNSPHSGGPSLSDLNRCLTSTAPNSVTASNGKNYNFSVWQRFSATHFGDFSENCEMPCPPEDDGDIDTTLVNATSTDPTWTVLAHFKVIEYKLLFYKEFTEVAGSVTTTQESYAKWSSGDSACKPPSPGFCRLSATYPGPVLHGSAEFRKSSQITTSGFIDPRDVTDNSGKVFSFYHWRKINVARDETSSETTNSNPTYTVNQGPDDLTTVLIAVYRPKAYRLKVQADPSQAQATFEIFTGVVDDNRGYADPGQDAVGCEPTSNTGTTNYEIKNLEPIAGPPIGCTLNSQSEGKLRLIAPNTITSGSNTYVFVEWLIDSRPTCGGGTPNTNIYSSSGRDVFAQVTTPNCDDVVTAKYKPKTGRVFEG